MVCTWLIDSDQFESAKVKTGIYFFILLVSKCSLTYLTGEMLYCEQSVVQKSSCRSYYYLNSFLMKTIVDQEELGKWNFNRIPTLEDFFWGII